MKHMLRLAGCYGAAACISLLAIGIAVRQSVDWAQPYLVVAILAFTFSFISKGGFPSVLERAGDLRQSVLMVLWSTFGVLCFALFVIAFAQQGVELTQGLRFWSLVSVGSACIAIAAMLRRAGLAICAGASWMRLKATATSATQVSALGVLLPLAAGYFMSYLFRNANGVLATDVMRDLGIGADGLGQITSVYFLVFAAAQFPIGALLDRYGPRCVQAALMMCAAAGAAVSCAAPGFAGAFAGRLLIGLGTAGSLVAGLKGIASLYPRERHAMANGLFVMCGGLGALAATWPIEAALGILTWRDLFGVLAAVALGVSLVTSILAPGVGPHTAAVSRVDLRDIFADPLFYHFAPLSACCFGTVLAVQGLWAGPWLTDVEGLSRGQSASALGYMAVALILAGPLWGAATRWLQRRTSLRHVMAAAALLLIATELLIVTAPLRLPLVTWCVFGLFGGMSVLSFTILAQHFPSDAVGRANGALNTLHIGWSFLVQLGIGHVVALWPATDGHYPAVGYRAALTLAIVCQAGAFAWFALSGKRHPRRGTDKEAHEAPTVELPHQRPTDQGSAA